MAEITTPNLNGVAETLFTTLYLRAMESQRPDALIKDDKAVELITRIGYDFNRVRAIPLSELNKLALILRNREFDRYTRDFLARNPEAVVVQIGCGLDSRFERVDNGQVEWFDLDFPHVIDLRRKYLGSERNRYHLLGCSVLNNDWLKVVSAYTQRPFLFLAEGVFMYFEAEQVKSVVLTLRDYFPGAELVFDAYSPVSAWRHNLQTFSSKIHHRINWGIWQGRKIEGWGDGIRLLDEWGLLDRPEPRLARIRWLRPIESFFRTIRIYHFKLGEAPE